MLLFMNAFEAQEKNRRDIGETEMQDWLGLSELLNFIPCHIISLVKWSSSILKLVRFHIPVAFRTMFKNLIPLIINKLLKMSSLNLFMFIYIYLFLCQYCPLNSSSHSLKYLQNTIISSLIIFIVWLNKTSSFRA